MMTSAGVVVCMPDHLFSSKQCSGLLLQGAAGHGMGLGHMLPVCCLLTALQVPGAV